MNPLEGTRKYVKPTFLIVVLAGLLGLAGCANPNDIPVNFPLVKCDSNNPSDKEGSVWTNSKGGVKINDDVAIITTRGKIELRINNTDKVVESGTDSITIRDQGKIFTASSKDGGIQVDGRCK